MTPTDSTMPRKLKTWQTIRLSTVRERCAEGYAAQPPSMRDGAHVARLLRQYIGDEPREQFVACYLDARHRPIGIYTVAIGGVANCSVDMRAIFTPAVLLMCQAIVVAHNHPSGDAIPSAEDRAITERIRSSGTILGFSVLDHLVIGDKKFFSFADETTHPL